MADAKQGKATQEDLHNGSSQSRVILAKPRLGGFGSSSFASSSNKTCNPFASVLRPPQLKPTSNPFYKLAEKPEYVEAEKEIPPQSEPVERLQDKKEEVDSPKFVPLASGGANTRSSSTVPAPAQPTTATSSAGFVFGQNISERVVMADSVNNGDATGLDHSSSNGATELLFTNAAASVKENNQEEAGPSENSGEGLAAAAAEYERSHARPPPPTSNCTTTGEEDEINVLQITCRLFAWESGSWRERGRGVLRLNDAPQGSGSGSGSGGGSGGSGGGGGSRLVVRVAGSLRVVLNTKLWPDMVLERAGAKSLRITAFDAQLQIKLYLIMGAPCDIVHLYRALTARILGSKRTISCNQNLRSQRAAERLEAATDDADYPDKPDINEDDSCFEEDKQNFPEPQQDEGGEPIISNRLENNPDMTDLTDEEKSNVHIKIDDQNESNTLKRKEPIENETSPKRQCPEIVIQRP